MAYQDIMLHMTGHSYAVLQLHTVSLSRREDWGCAIVFCYTEINLLPSLVRKALDEYSCTALYQCRRLYS